MKSLLEPFHKKQSIFVNFSNVGLISVVASPPSSLWLYQWSGRDGMARCHVLSQVADPNSEILVGSGCGVGVINQLKKKSNFILPFFHYSSIIVMLELPL